MHYRSFLAPLDEYTDLPFRLLCQRYGAEAVCAPLVNSEALARNRSKILMVRSHSDEKNFGVQLVGSDPVAIGKAAAVITGAIPHVRWLNLNCGCPSSRTMDNGSGSALLGQPEKIAQSIAGMKKQTDINLSVKIRIKDNALETLSLCKSIEDAGADFLIVHGRTVRQHYSGKADWNAIRKVKERMTIPVVGNGDIGSASEGKRLVKEGHCDAYMVGRAAMSNPLLFSDRKPDGLGERFALLAEYLALYERYLGEPQLKDVKLKAVNFVSGAPDASSMRNRIARAKSVEDIVALGE